MPEIKDCPIGSGQTVGERGGTAFPFHFRRLHDRCGWTRGNVAYNAKMQKIWSVDS